MHTFRTTDRKTWEMTTRVNHGKKNFYLNMDKKDIHPTPHNLDKCRMALVKRQFILYIL